MSGWCVDIRKYGFCFWCHHKLLLRIFKKWKGGQPWLDFVKVCLKRIKIVCFFLSQTFSKDQYFLNLLNFGRLHVSACRPDHICQWTDQWSQIYLKTNNRLNTFTFTPSQTSKGFKNNHPSGVVSLWLPSPWCLYSSNPPGPSMPGKSSPTAPCNCQITKIVMNSGSQLSEL